MSVAIEELITNTIQNPHNASYMVDSHESLA